MQLIPRYLYKNQVDVISNDIGFVVEYRPVYSRQLKVYEFLPVVLIFFINFNIESWHIYAVNK